MIVLKIRGEHRSRTANGLIKLLILQPKQIKSAPLMISSAMGKTTDRLVEIADFAAGKK